VIRRLGKVKYFDSPVSIKIYQVSNAIKKIKMKKVIFVLKRTQVILLFAAMLLFSVKESGGANNDQLKGDPPFSKITRHTAGNPYLPLWEHLPDGEPRVFEDPDNPGKYRIYIIGSHDVRFRSYCGPDIRAWSAPVEDLSSWRDEGPIFTYPIGGQWDVMYAPDLVEVRRKDGTKEYYLYPHSRGRNREAMVAKGTRPDGPFTPVNVTEDGMGTLPGSTMGFDPSVYIEYITDPKDPDYNIGFRAYGFWGFQRSSAGQLDQNTMYSLRPGTQVIGYFIPASSRYGVVRDPEGTTYPSVFPDQNLGSFNFFEAASIRKVGNKYVWVYSGYSGPDYGLGSTNSALRYAYGDSPLGPWKSGGVLVDSRAVVSSQDGTALQTSYSGHNTHGSIELINDQWYVFYHRAPRGFGNARQPMVAPVKIVWDEKPVAEGGKVTIRGYNPYTEDNAWTAKDSQGREYTGAEVTSEGFHIYGLDPYQYYSAGYACYLSNPNTQQDSWDIWDNNMPVANVENGHIIGYKYFGFGGLDKDKKGLKAFKGTRPGNKTAFNLFLTPKSKNSFKINVWLDGPWDNATWKGKKIGEINVPANSAQEVTKFTVDVSAFVDRLDKKHAIFLVAEGSDQGALFDLTGLGFSTKKMKIVRPVAPIVSISVNGETIELPATPVRSTNANGIVSLDLYETSWKLPSGITGIPAVSASASDPAVKVTVTQAESNTGTAVVQFDYKGVVKTYRVAFAGE
jgi:arabinoxylan arabinofuranohydrolase